MKNIRMSSFLLMLMCIHTCVLTAQKRTITGFVTTLENVAVVNAEVLVLSSKVTVLTDSIGRFEIHCKSKDKIKISAKGFNTQKVKVNEKTKKAFINLKMKLSDKNLDVAVGYGHIKEKDKLHAITTIRNNEESKFLKYTNMYDLIRNSSPSVEVNNGIVVIRGVNSVNGNSAALIVVDGVPQQSSVLRSLSPFNIKSVSILKGTAASVYGARGANGVVLITTKKGKD